MGAKIVNVLAILLASSASAAQASNVSLLVTSKECALLDSRVSSSVDGPAVSAAKASLAEVCRGAVGDPLVLARRGDPKAVLYALVTRLSKVSISDEDLVRAIENGMASGDPEFLYWLSVFVASPPGSEFSSRVGLQELFGETPEQSFQASVAWFEAACARGLDCSDAGLLAKVNCALGNCDNALVRSRAASRSELVATFSVGIAAAIDSGKLK